MNKYGEIRADKIMGSEAVGHGQGGHRLNLDHFSRPSTERFLDCIGHGLMIKENNNKEARSSFLQQASDITALKN